jgi:hypothetical protein
MRAGFLGPPKLGSTPGQPRVDPCADLQVQAPVRGLYLFFLS